MWASRLLYFLGCWLSALAVLQFIPLIHSLAVGNERAAAAFIASSGLSMLVGGSLWLGYRGSETARTPAMTILLPLTGYLFIGMISGLPFFFSDMDFGLIPALYEGVSMITTNGASAYDTNTDASELSFMLWRALVAWIGGFGALVFALSLLSETNSGAMQLHRTCLAVGVNDKGYVRLFSITRALLPFYSLITCVAAFLFTVSGTPFIDAVILAMATISTTGISAGATNEIASSATMVITAVFMIFASYNWDYSHLHLNGKKSSAYRPPGLVPLLKCICIGVISLWLLNIMTGSHHSLTDLAYVVISAVSTTGFIPEGFALYYKGDLGFALIIVALTTIGGCVVSTSGGLKQMRFMILWKLGRHEIDRLAHPSGVHTLKLGGSPIKVQDMEATWLLIGGLTIAFILGTLWLAIFSVDFQSAVAMTITTLTLSGPMIALVDPYFPGFVSLQSADYVILSVLAVIGRVEASLFMAFLARTFWR